MFFWYELIKCWQAVEFGYGDCGSAEARHLAPVLHWIAAEDPEPAVLAAVVAGSAEDQSEVQPREAIVAGSDSAEPGE